MRVNFYNHLDWRQDMKCRYLQELVAIVALATVMLAAAAVHADGAKQHDPSVLRVITYNVQFLPDPVSWKNERPEPEYRAGRIAEELCRFDVAGLQEVFHAKYRAQLVDRVRSGWKGELHQLVSPQPAGFFTSGGCLVLSHRPILKSTSMVFTNYSKPADYGQRADGYAAKGVLHARIARSAGEPSNFVDVFVTHLEARADRLRPLQYKEMANFIRTTSNADHPFILLGDLNTYGMADFQTDPKSQYSQLMQELRGMRPDRSVIDLWPTLRGNSLGGTTEQESSEIGKRVDYILLGNPRRSEIQLTPKQIDVEPYQDARVVALSDHSAVVAELDWPIRTTTGETTR